MREIDIRKTQYAVGDFVGWQRDGTLDLRPPFQRRSVWKPDAKSYFIDTVVRGLPAPIIYLRQAVTLHDQRPTRVVIDGQQRLRTIFAYVDRTLLPDFSEARDGFSVKAIHNRELSGQPFAKLERRLQQRILSYELSTHVLPETVEDGEVLEMFARLNATGVKLNHQELRNAAFFGELKTAAYELALEHLGNWRRWDIVSDDQIARMKEVEITSDLLLNILSGLTAKAQPQIDALYKKYDERFPTRDEVCRRFRQTMAQIDDLAGPWIRTTSFRGEAFFSTLFVYLYDRMYGLGSKLVRKSPTRLTPALGGRLLEVAQKIDKGTGVPPRVLDAMRRAPGHLGRRRTRLDFLKHHCDGTS